VLSWMQSTEGIDVVDNDEIRWTIPQSWQRPAYLATSNSPIEQTAPSAEHSLYRTVAAPGGGGCPGLEELIRLLQQFWHACRQPQLFGSPEALADQRRALFEALDGVEEHHDDHKHTCLASGVVREFGIALSQGSWFAASEHEIARCVTDAFCRRVVEHYYFAPLQPPLQRRLGLNHRGVREWQADLLRAMAPFIAQTAGLLLQDNTGATVKKPDPRTRYKKSTSDLLSVNLLGKR
jgi:hypothetical protein